MKNKGFTLIELVIVIVILGILATVAAPRFLNVQTDARNAALEGLDASIDAALDIAYGKLVVGGLENEVMVHEEVKDWCEFCLFSHGYPASLPNTWEHLVDGVKYGPNATDFRVGSIRGNTDALAFSAPQNFDTSQFLTVEDCYIKYTISNHSLEMVECK